MFLFAPLIVTICNRNWKPAHNYTSIKKTGNKKHAMTYVNKHTYKSQWKQDLPTNKYAVSTQFVVSIYVPCVVWSSTDVRASQQTMLTPVLHTDWISLKQ